MTWPPSSSETVDALQATKASPVSDSRPSSAFTQLHPKIQRWVWAQNWCELRDAQERAAGPILAGHRDLIIAAATASGKTEAAFLPICSALLDARDGTDRDRPAGLLATEPATADATGVQVLYISPLKALINDQYGRLDALCEHLEIPVHRWHGDVASSRKAKVLAHPDGLLLITPESLEALLVIHGPKVGPIFGGLRYVVIDEMHSFLGTERGAQLQSLLHRVELAIRRRVPRIGLSATLGDMAAAAEFLRPGRGDTVTVITAADDTQELRIQLRGYEATPAHLSPAKVEKAETRGERVETEDLTTGDRLGIANDLFATLRGTDNLIFANSRRNVEIYADLLKRRSDHAQVPNEFLPHHGSLSKELREYVEARLKDRDQPVSAVCTSTLEMGIDIGSVSSIAQLGAPHTVSSLRQRLGRSGRRGGAATLRLYISEEQVTAQTPPPDALRTELVQSIAMINLLLERWNEAPDSGGLHLSTLTQQLLSLIAQHGGITPMQAHQTLCLHGPFAQVTQTLFKALLRALAVEKVDLITQGGDGLLLLGVAGERLVNHYSFYAAFRTAEEYRLIAYGRPLGTLPIDYPLMPGSLLIFGGRRWKVLAVDAQAKVVELVRSSGGRPPLFTGSGGEIADRVRQEMATVYATTVVPAYLDSAAVRLLAEGRTNFTRFGLGRDPLLTSGEDTLIFAWRGDRILSTLAVALTGAGFDVAQDGVCLTMTGADRATTIGRLRALLAQGPPDPVTLAARVGTKIAEKYDDQLTQELLNEAFAARSLDVDGAWDAVRGILDNLSADHHPARDHPAFVASDDPPVSAVTTRPRPVRLPELGRVPFAVLDLETTGFSPWLRDRVVEVAVVRTAPDGTVEESWTTLLNPGRDVGPTHLHGIRSGDVVDAPRFVDVAGDIAARLDGAVVVAHNARFDLGFLTAEYARLGATTPAWPTLCTLALSYHLGLLGGGRLDACIAAEGLTHQDKHSALGDATATAGLLATYLSRAAERGITNLADLGCAPITWPDANWSAWSVTGKTHPRSNCGSQGR
jgi:ATP-dependent Lhr-like helicase